MLYYLWYVCGVGWLFKYWSVVIHIQYCDKHPNCGAEVQQVYSLLDCAMQHQCGCVMAYLSGGIPMSTAVIGSS